MFQVVVTMSDDTVHAFTCESATQAVEYAAFKFPGYVRLEAKGPNSLIQLGRRRVPNTLPPDRE